MVQKKKNKLSLLEWFLGNKNGSTIQGYAHHKWNGVTTLQFAQLCEKIIETKNLYENLLHISHVHHFHPNTIVTKYELLNIFKNIYQKDVIIEKVDNIGPPVDRTLSSNFHILSELYHPIKMEQAIIELKEWTGKQSEAYIPQ